MGVQPSRLTALLLLLALGTSSMACTGREPHSGPLPPPVAVAAVEIVPDVAELIAGGVLRLEALPTDALGEDLSDRSATWSSSDESIARIDRFGLLEAIAPGQVAITVTIEGIVAAASILVVPPPVGRVMLEPDTLELLEGEERVLTASVFDVWGNPLPEIAVGWSSSDPTTVAVDSAGKVYAVHSGGATIIAEAEGVRGTASVTVQPTPIAAVVPEVEALEVHAGRELQLVAAAVDAHDRPLPEVEIYWTSSDPQVATIDGDGLLRAWSAGETLIGAHAGTSSAEIEVRVLPMSVLRIDVDPAEASVLVGDELRLSALVIGVDEQPLFGRAISWSSSDEDLATVDSRGSVQTFAPGKVSITASTAGVEASGILTLYVPPPLVGSITFPPMTRILRRGEFLVLEPTIRDKEGNLISPENLEWRSNEPSIATVTFEGTVTGRAHGFATITVSIEDVSASVVVQVMEISRVVIQGAPGSLLFGQSFNVRAQAMDMDGRPIVWPVELRSSDASVLTVNQDVVTAVGAGTATLQASLLDVSAAVSIDVVELPRFDSLAVGPAGSCALGEDGRLFCWGSIGSNLPQTGVPTHRPTPIPFRELSLGGNHLCGLGEAGEAYCAGNGAYGQIGPIQGNSISTFQRIFPEQSFHSLEAGSAYSCGIDLEGQGHCWGTSTALGIGPFDAYPNTLTPIDLDVPFLLLRTSSNRTVTFIDASCGIVAGGRAYCWGANVSGELGNGSTEQWALSPTPIAGDLRFQDLSIATQRLVYDPPLPGDPPLRQGSHGHGCGVTIEGEGYCWGANSNGELGDGSTTPSALPVRVQAEEPFASIQVSAPPSGFVNVPAPSFSCGLTDSGRALCWGARGGQLGTGTPRPSLAPTPVAGDLRFRSLGLGQSHVCGLTLEGLLYCWGSNGYGLGVGPPSVDVPTLVIGQRPPAPGAAPSGE